MSDKNWLQEHRQSLITPKQFHKRGFIDHDTLLAADRIKQQLQFRLPQRLAAKMTDKNLKNQFIPQKAELTHHPLERLDPIGDDVFSPVSGITHRYKDRVLLKPTHHCAVYCRFCFRREKVSSEGYELNGEKLQAALLYIKEHKEITEVILSGGDPLTLTDRKLKEILSAIEKMPHVRLMRFHTRIPTVLPSRITRDLIKLLSGYRVSVWMVAHINAPSELDSEARLAIKALVDGGIPMLHQGVLLKGVNDCQQTLKTLFMELITLRVKPYYLHYPDLANGTNHFRVPLAEALSLVGSLRGELPGYALPSLCIDIPGGGGKVVADLSRVEQISDTEFEIISPITGKKHVIAYPC